MEKYKEVDEEVGEAAQSKLRRHLWYLSETNVALAFFDEEISLEMKRKMVQNLNIEGHPESPSRILLPVEKIMSSEISDFVTNNTLFFFDTILNEEITKVNQNFLKNDPSTWETNENFINAKEILKKLLVVNDIAERGVSLITRFNTVLTHQEQQKQFILHAMEQHYKEISIDTYSKKKFIEYLNNHYKQAQKKK